MLLHALPALMWLYTFLLLLVLASAQDAPQHEEFTSHFWNGIDAAEQDQVCVAAALSMFANTLITTPLCLLLPPHHSLLA
jgi:hypothetical protein